MNADTFERIGLVVHPRRELGRALATVEEWAQREGAELIQVRAPGHEQQVAPAGVAVLGVACGSLGALTAVTAEDLEDALSRVARDDWRRRRLPALVVEQDGKRVTAINDLVLVRAGAG